MRLNFTNYFIKRPVVFWSLMAAFVVAGIISFSAMPKLEDPAVAGKQAMVVVPYPGASAHEVELKVALLMEEKLRELPNVRKIKTDCQPGMAMFTVEFQMSVLMSEIEQYFDLVRRKVNDTKSQLPQDCYDPIVVDDMMDVYGIFYSLTGDGYSYPEMEKYAKLIRRELLEVKGVKRVILSGARQEVIDIIINKEKISRNGLIPTQIMMSLNNAGKTVSGGLYEANGENYALRVSEAINNEEDIKDIMISTSDGKTIRVGDIAEVKRTYSEPWKNGFFVNGEPSMAICIAMETDAIVPDVGKAVDQKLAEVMKTLPVGIVTDKVFFQPEKVDEAISGFMINLVESVLIVILVLMFTMGFRSGAIIGTGLILTICVSFPILLMLGTTLHRISLGAFIVAMGMLVDNSIVIMDGILIDKQRGYGPKTYLFRIGKNTAIPLLGATIIAASTFLANYLSPDTAGEYAGDLFLVLCVSLLASWFLALTQVPVCAKSWLEPRVNKNKAGKKLNDSKIHHVVRKVVTKLIEYKYVTILVATILLGVCGYGMTKVKNLFFPDFDYKQFVVEYYLPQQSSPDRVRKDLLEMTDTLLQNPDIERVVACMGSAPAHYCLVRPMTNGGDCYGELIIDCKDFNTVKKITPAIRQMLRESYPDAYIRLRRYNFSIATTHTVEVEFSGPDPAVLKSLSAQAEQIMRECEYVDPYSVSNNWRPTGKTLTAEYQRDKGIRCGIERSDVASALQAATDGLPVGVINNQDNMVLVNLKVRNADQSRITDLNEIPVWSMMNLHFSDEDIAGIMQNPHAMSKLSDKIFT
ncbi:MAG: efflux RND transporter permease subunit, partial [Bacteroidales bacterium]|nr:efflux RND transporter permease subunit [Bacteroidales bacterium]